VDTRIAGRRTTGAARMMTTTSTRTTSRGAWVARAIAGVVVASLAARAIAYVGPRLPGVVAWVESFGAVAGPVCRGIYAAAVVLFIPASWLTLAAGAVFGLAWGITYVFAGAVIGSGLAFLVGRHVARPWVERWAQASPRFSVIDRAVATDGRRIVFL